MSPEQAAQIEEMRQVLYDEAALLDERRFDEWLGLMTDDLVYEAPVRVTRERGQEPDVSPDMHHFRDTRRTLQLRVDRLHTDFAWAEDPPSRTRRLVGNVRISPAGSTGSEGELAVSSCLLLYRSRGDEPQPDIVSAERRDFWRRAGGAWKLARRIVLLDQSTLGIRSLSNFL